MNYLTAAVWIANGLLFNERIAIRKEAQIMLNAKNEAGASFFAYGCVSFSNVLQAGRKI